VCAILVATATTLDEDCLALVKECSLPIEPYISDMMTPLASLKMRDTICPYVNYATLLTGAMLIDWQLSRINV